VTDGAGKSGLDAQFARLITGHIFLHAAMAGTRMAAPLLALSLGYSTGAAGMLVALFALTQVFLSLPAGRYADRHGLKRPVRLSVIAASTGVGLAAIWPVYPVLCVSALLVGGAIGAATISVQRHVGKAAQTPTQLKKAFSWLSIAPAMSNFLGPFAAGLMIDHAGFRAAFLMLAVLPLVAWAIIRRTPELPHDAPVDTAAGGRAWDMLRDPVFRRLLFMNGLMSASWDLHSFMVPILGHERGLPASIIGSILGSFAIAAAVVRVVMPLVGSLLREWALITGAIAITGLLLIAYPFTRSALSMGMVSVLMGLTLGTVQPMVMSMLHQITPRHRHGEALAIRLILVNTSSVTMPMILGTAGGVLGVSAVFWAMGVVLAAGSHLGLSLRGADVCGH